MRLPLLAVLLVAASGCATTSFDPTRATGFRLVESAGHRHYVYLPSDWTAERKWPVIVYLHGGGERGTDGVAPTQIGLGPLVAGSGGGFPAVVVFPQSSPKSAWAIADMRARVLAVVDDAIANLGGDPRRIYLTGPSMGGYGTWLIAGKHPDRFAALVPLCGGVKPPSYIPVPQEARELLEGDPYAKVAGLVRGTPVWAFHGAKDWLIPPSESRSLVAALEKLGSPVRYTELAEAGHTIEDRVYAQPGVLAWMLEQRRAVVASPVTAAEKP